MENISYQRATLKDNIAIAALIKLARKEDGNLYPEGVDEDIIYWVIETITDGYVIKATAGNKIIGTISFTIRPWPWNRKRKWLHNEWLFVHRAYRNMGVSDKLIGMAKMLAEDYGLDLAIGMMSGVKPEVKDRYVATKGLRYAGGFLLKLHESKENVESVRSENEGGIEQSSLG